MKRRDFLKLTGGGMVAVIASQMGMLPRHLQNAVYAQSPGRSVNLTATEALVEMVDLTRVYHWVWQVQGAELPSLPGPDIIATEGEEVTVSVTNALDEPHAFALISGADFLEPQGGVPLAAHGPSDPAGTLVAGTETGPIAPGDTASVTFTAPTSGTYIYADPLNAPVNRVLGLNGVFISLPVAPFDTPYTAPTPNVQALFDALGGPDFPGQPWNPERTWIWNFFSIDPSLNSRVEQGEQLDPGEFVQDNEPRYWAVNGKTGFFAAHDETIRPFGSVGNPALIRNINTGITTHSPHTHGNHMYIIAVNNVVQENVIKLDTWTVRPTSIYDVLHPFEQPPDAAVFPPVEEPFPQIWTVHCHIEPSQTANGGNYPQGLIPDWDLLGPLGGVAGGPGTFPGDPQAQIPFEGPGEEPEDLEIIPPAEASP